MKEKAQERNSHHEAIVSSLNDLNFVISKADQFLIEVIHGNIPPPSTAAEKEEGDLNSLANVLKETPGIIRGYTERLESILSGLRNELL